MTTIWFPDTCDCVIAVEPKEYRERCRLHRKAKDVSVQQAHHDSFRLMHGRNPSESQIVDIEIKAHAEKLRIRTADLHEHTLGHHTPTFMENLRRVLRI